MAQKDYVSRAKRNGQKKRTPRSKKNTVKTAKSSPITLLLLIIVIAAFAGGLYFLKNNKSAPPTPSAPKDNSKKSAQNDIPPAPKPRWDYVDALVNPNSQTDAHSNTVDKNGQSNGMSQEQQRILSLMAADRPQNTNNSPSTYNQQVDRNSQTTPKQTPAASQSPVAPAAQQNWMLQCGSFKNKDGAESIKAQLAMSGISSQIVFSGNLHRVMVGPYKTKEAANAMHSQLASAGVQGCNLRG